MTTENKVSNSKIFRNTTLILTNAAIILGGVACASEQQTPPGTTLKTKTAETALPGTVTSAPTLAETQLPTFIPTESPTAESTKTPEVSFNCPVNPDAPNMTEITSLSDLPKLADWALKQPAAQGQISANPSKLDYTFDLLPSDGTGGLSAQLNDEPGWVARHSNFIGVCKINPQLLGFPGKDTGRLLISVIQDKNDRRAIQFNFAAEHFAREMYFESQFTDTIRNWIVPKNDESNYSDGKFIPKGAQPGSSADLRTMEDAETFFAAQGNSKAEVDLLFQEIANTDTFSDSTIQKLHSTIFYTATGWNLRK